MNRMVEMIGRWTHIVFVNHIKQITPKVRALRLLEEVIELCQAENITEAEIDIIKRQVMDKPAGYNHSEFAGVMVTLMGYAWTRNFDPEDSFWVEFARIMRPEMIEKIRSRNLGGDKIGIEL